LSGSRREIVREVYSEVLFDLAQQSAELESVLEELMAVRGVLKAEPEFAALLSSQIVKSPEKAEIVRRVFGGRLSELTVNFLSVLARRGRMGFLGGVSEKYELLVDAHHNRRAVEVTMASKPDDEQIMKLKADLGAALDSKVKLSIKVDPKIIGGVIIKKDDTLVDNSVRTALNRTIQSVMENMKSREGQAGSIDEV
jgi:F-type H+-transporting ATPase subunit delta